MPNLKNEIAQEVKIAIRQHPNWPDDIIHAAAVVVEEAGELMKAALQSVYEPEKSNLIDARIEAIQTAATCVRFIHGIDREIGKLEAEANEKK